VVRDYRKTEEENKQGGNMFGMCDNEQRTNAEAKKGSTIDS
jgi:hypothetical protein